MDKKFLGICIVAASIIISGTILYTSLFINTGDRYKVAGARVFDTREGKFVEEQGKYNQEITDKIDTAQNQVLDDSIIKYNIQIPEKINSAKTFSDRIASRTLNLTVKNISSEYIVNYIELEIKLYKDEVAFYKETEIIGDKENIHIGPLSSYNISYLMDGKITYPDQPWKSEVITKVVKGTSAE